MQFRERFRIMGDMIGFKDIRNILFLRCLGANQVVLLFYAVIWMLVGA
jgi:hypothetical protein